MGWFNFHRAFLILLLFTFTWIFTALAWDLHDGMRTHKADLGQIAQAVWNSSQGRFVEMTDNGPLATRMTDHVEPVLALISPVLWLWRDVKALLLLQVILAAVGGWLLYGLAVARFDSLLTTTERSQIWHLEPLRQLTGPIALALVAGFLLSPQLQNGLLTEFHAAPLAVPLILWAFLSVERKRWGQFTIATLLTALVKEEMALLAAGLGLWAIWRLTLTKWPLGGIDDRRLSIVGAWRAIRGRQPSLSSSHPLIPSPPHLLILSVTLLCLVWFYLATFVIVPAHAVEVYATAENPYWARYGALGDSPVDIVKSFFTQPGMVWQIASQPVRLHYLWMMLASFGFLSLLAPEILLLSLPLLLANLLSEYPPQYYGEFHYSAPLVAYFGVSALYGGARLWRLIGRQIGGASPSFQHMPASSLGVMAVVAFLRNGRTTFRPLLSLVLVGWVLVWATLLYRDEGRGPGGKRYDPTTVNAHHRLLDRFVAQLPPDASVTVTAAVHPHVALRRFVYQFPIGLAQFGQPGAQEAEWALLDVTTNTDLAPGDLRDMVMTMVAGEWGVVDGADGFLLLRRGVSEKVIPAAFYDFARLAGGDSDDTSVPLMLQGITANDRPRWRATMVTSEWLVGPGFEPAVNEPRLAILRPDGLPIYQLGDATPPALIWYAPDQWQTGERIRITTPALFLPKAWSVIVGTVKEDTPSLIGANGWRWATTYLRGDNQQLLQVAPPLDQPARLFTQMTAQLGADKNPAVAASFDVTPFDGNPARLFVSGHFGDAELFSEGGGQSRSVDLLLHWTRQGPWPPQLTPFIHLRQDGENLAQTDGLPRWFLPYSAEALSPEGLELIDWRRLVPPTQMVDNPASPTNEWQIVIGLYDAESGGRAEVLNAQGEPIGNELPLGTLLPAKASMPDFACALVPVTCASQ